ncbi:unnamed protein product [Rangifer tarandus platyrhynchus]|uniref:Uncharacterized protein n=2 Tax=Rangifer tarandus platyrhynchus TaxID=3082113 RepID=A0ABN8YST8_RANTA|nr:unnamed protein product [Rangifer tarandus platyrhynchus]
MEVMPPPQDQASPAAQPKYGFPTKFNDSLEARWNQGNSSEGEHPAGEGVSPGHKACGILAVHPGTEPASLALEDKDLVTVPPGKSLLLRLHKSRNIIASCGNYCRIQIFLPNALFFI